MYFNLSLGMFLLLTSCSFGNKQTQNEKYELNHSDTTLTYDITGISLEGADAKVNYKKGKIVSAEISLYGETGQGLVVYTFLLDEINVVEKEYRYEKGLESIKNNEDLNLVRESSYVIDYNGGFLEKSPEEIFNIYEEFKEQVPFKL